MNILKLGLFSALIPVIFTHNESTLNLVLRARVCEMAVVVEGLLRVLHSLVMLWSVEALFTLQ